MHIFLSAIVLLTIIGIFWERYINISMDAEASPTDISFGEFFKHTVVEMVINLLLFTGYYLGIDLTKAIELANEGTVGTPAPAEALTIAGAVALGLLIYKTSQKLLLIWNGITGAVTARKLLREKVMDAKNKK